MNVYVLCVFYYVSVFVNVCILFQFCRKVNKVVYKGLVGKITTLWQPNVETVEDMAIRFDKIHERYRRTERQTDRQTSHDGRGRVCA